MNDKISVIIPAYNIEKEVKHCVESVLNQTFQSMEIIIVNDGSTDGTLAVLQQLAQVDSRIIIVDKKNEGVTKARLTGVELATGNWIGFVDGDDYIDPDMYERLISNAKKYDADISHCGYQMVFPSRVDYYYNTGRVAKQNNITGMKDLLAGTYVEPGLWNKLFHVTLFHSLLQCDKMDTTIKNFEDLLMNYYLFAESKLSIYEDFCPYHYIVRNGSAANSNPNKLHDWIKVSDLLIEETRDNDILVGIMRQKLIHQLISVSTMDTIKGNIEARKFKKDSLNRLRKESLFVLMRKEYGLKTKIMTVGACLSPKVYGLIHKAYQKLTGVDKKYDIS